MIILDQPGSSFLLTQPDCIHSSLIGRLLLLHLLNKVVDDLHSILRINPIRMCDKFDGHRIVPLFKYIRNLLSRFSVKEQRLLLKGLDYYRLMSGKI